MDLGDISYRVGTKFCWQYSMAQPRKPPYRRKNLADIFSRSQAIAHFVPNFVACNQKLRLYLIHSQSYDRLKNCLTFPMAPL